MNDSAKKKASDELAEASEDAVQLHPGLEEKLERIVEAKLAERMARLDSKVEDIVVRVNDIEEAQTTDRLTMVVFSGEFDRLMAGFIIATGAAAMGMEVSMYFTFWGLTAVKKKTAFAGKSVLEKMVSVMLPGGPDSVGTSRLNFLGMGPVFFKTLMKRNNVETLPDLVSLAQDLDVKMIACQMSISVMGIQKEELLDTLEYGGVATYLGDAADSKTTLFI